MPEAKNPQQAQFDKMTKTPIPRLVMGLAVPTILSMLITSIYNLADTFFVGQISTSASGAVGVVSSLMAVIQAVGFMLGHGVGKAGRATFLSCCRQGIFFIPLILALPRAFGLAGVQYSQPIADALSFVVAVPFMAQFLAELDRMDAAERRCKT